ncbi:rhodanese-like domain-containing protein [Gulosibacter molinativorax]|uniref:Rhodanese-like domain-containing protein n=1 Tax=Gulosibacter molinativorax TaxID=256821 RepID=A0ABT7CBN4_9MICO|nr:rhodanese-like domain-containing protein [Gulosibacter molinativorax]MDJ1372606.1 rhodanese-like domain-containing protein [Gulosibacter molinativorax]QUY62268.1 Thiosulfate sulfurtransferase PspE [Gulosibacter molinativorax]
MRRTIAATLSAVTLLFGLAACATAPNSAGSSGDVEVGPDAVILDVRTPEEYAGGHLEGAQLLDFNGGEVAAAIPNLDPEAEYFVYCRSGNRSAQAIALLEQAGFSNLTNLGSLDQAAAATGISIVR